jgi:hypothetical protein
VILLPTHGPRHFPELEGVGPVYEYSVLVTSLNEDTESFGQLYRNRAGPSFSSRVIGRGLRRQSYDLNDEDLFNVECADILGIPFDFAAKPVIAPVGKRRETVASMRCARIATHWKSGFRASRAIKSSCRRSGSTPSSAQTLQTLSYI